MVFTVTPGNLQWFGIAKETVSGVAQATPTLFFGVNNPKFTPKPTVLVDQTLRGNMGMDQQQIQGMTFDEIAGQTFIYSDSAYALLLAMFGNPDTIVGAADPYAHSTSLYNAQATGAQPSTYTTFLYHGNGKVRQTPGCVLTDLKVDIKVEQIPTIDFTFNGLPGAWIAAPTNTPSTVQPMPTWTAVISVAGNTISKYSQITCDYKRGTKPLPVLNGSQSPIAIYAGEMSVALNLDAVYQGGLADNDVANLIANTQPAITVAISPAGDAVHTLTLQHSVCAYDTVTPGGTNSGWMTVQSTLKALTNATDGLGGASPAKVTYRSAQSTAY